MADLGFFPYIYTYMFFNSLLDQKGIYCKLEKLFIWQTGEDQNTAAEFGRDSYSENDDDGGADDDDNNWYDSEESSPSPSPYSSSSRDHKNDHHSHGIEEENDDILVVAGCKSCYMYFMVAKKTEGCPKCNGQLLRFDHHHEWTQIWIF